MPIDGKIEFIKAKFDARPAPEDGERENRMYSLKQRGAIADWLRDLAKPNIWDGLTDDQQNVLTKAPFNIHTDRASWKEKKKTDALEKRRNELGKFQKKYGVGVRPPPKRKSGMKLSKEELSLGASINTDLRNYRGKADNRNKLSEEMLALYREYKLKEFDIDNEDDTTNHTILTAEEYDEWCNRNNIPTIRRSERGRDQNEPSDASPARATTRKSAAAAAAATATRSSTSTKKRSSTSTTTAGNPPKKVKTSQASWSDTDTKKLEQLENTYGTAWHCFESDPDCLPGKTTTQMCSKWDNMKKVSLSSMCVYFR